MTTITGRVASNCDGHHDLSCDAALSDMGLKPSIGNMPVISDRSVDVMETERERNGKAPARQVAQASKACAAPVRPSQVTWEMTRDCEWRATASRTTTRLRRQRPLFSTAEAFHLIEEISEMQVPLLALTGGDPLLRPDLFPVIEFATGRLLRTSLTLLPTPRLDAQLITELKQSGLMRVGLWLHGSTASLDDSYWGITGSHRRVLNAIGACHEVQLPVQINTTMSRRNVQDVDPMIELLTRLDVSLWNVFFFVPANQEQLGQMLTAEEHEQVFARLYAASKQASFQIRTTEGEHYQRFVWLQRARESRARLSGTESLCSVPKNGNDSRASVFVTDTGDVYPSRFLPLSGGNVTTQSFSQVYRESELLVSLRDSSRLKGKCGRCEMCQVCGGSRARAYAVTGDLFAEEPCCAYEPRT